MADDFRLPPGLTPLQRKAACTVYKLVKKKMGREPTGGGCTAFYTPQAWRERGEEYGTDSVLILCHDGGDLPPFCNMDYGGYSLQEDLQEALGEIGLFLEGCTCWYSAIYEI